MEILREGFFTGERALYNLSFAKIYDSVFADGESPLKESDNIKIVNSIFKWKYPLWYSSDISAEKPTLLETARSGIWYTKRINMTDCTIEAPKTFRRSSDINLQRCVMPIAQETLWYCKNITLKDVSAKGDYFGLSAENVYADSFTLNGNYAFDGGENIEINNSRLISKDAFWNCKNVVVRNSTIIGEYLGWNSENVTFIDCVIESNQGLCYMDNVRLVNCKLLRTDLAFEFSSVDADIKSNIISVKNPISGRINAHGVGEIILDKNLIDPSKTKISISEEKDEL